MFREVIVSKKNVWKIPLIVFGSVHRIYFSWDEHFKFSGIEYEHVFSRSIHVKKISYDKSCLLNSIDFDSHNYLCGFCGETNLSDLSRLCIPIRVKDCFVLLQNAPILKKLSHACFWLDRSRFPETEIKTIDLQLKSAQFIITQGDKGLCSSSKCFFESFFKCNMFGSLKEFECLFDGKLFSCEQLIDFLRFQGQLETLKISEPFQHQDSLACSRIIPFSVSMKSLHTFRIDFHQTKIEKVFKLLLNLSKGNSKYILGYWESLVSLSFYFKNNRGRVGSMLNIGMLKGYSDNDYSSEFVESKDNKRWIQINSFFLSKMNKKNGIVYFRTIQYKVQKTLTIEML